MIRLLHTGLFLLLYSFAFAQEPCSFDQMHKKQLLENPEYAKQIQAFEELYQLYRQAARVQSPNAVVEIPVVVHVLHTGGAVGTIYNPTDADITSTIAYVNSVFDGTLSGMEAPVNEASVVNLGVKFVLAKRTPSCGYTNGINRVDASVLSNYSANGVNNSNTNGVSDATLKDFARWDVTKYYNIYVVNKIDGNDGTSGQFVAGYAYFPGAGNVDGTVMLATQFKPNYKTLPHELGHAFGLYHPFEGSTLNTSCPVNTNCSTNGDRVCDTDPVAMNRNSSGVIDFTCRTGNNSCPTPQVDYNKNTEKNYMSYTSCYTLFTSGQRDRVTSALASASRQSLVNSYALTPCGPAVNFSTASLAVTEQAGTTIGCRKFKDYEVQLTIGEAPSANAVVTVSSSGSATEGLDFDFTTNNDFTTPSNTVTFAAGSTAPKPVLIRVYDDNDVDNGETISLSINVNNGGGNAVAGTTIPTTSLSIQDNDAAPSAYSNTIVNDGVSNSYIFGSVFDGSKKKHRTQFIITKAELNALGVNQACNINAMKLYIYQKNSTAAFTGLTISMANTTSSDLQTGFVATSFTTVYSSNYTSVVGTNEFPFTTNFNWNGTDNVLVNICWDNGTSSSGDDYLYTMSTSRYQMAFANYSSGSTSGCALSANLLSYSRPKLSLGIEIPGTTIETAVSTASEYVGNGSNTYLYSNNNKLLLNLQGVDNLLKCTQAEIVNSGSSWSTFLQGNRSAKVFKVTPAQNQSNTNYTIKLYYTNAELGSQSPANLVIVKSSAATIDQANATNSVVLTTTNQSLGSNATVFTASATGFSLFFLATSSALPLQWLDVSAVKKDKDIAVQWKTAEEKNTAYFEVEHSTNGSLYNIISKQHAQGSALINQYGYVHLNAGAGAHYYRIKQADTDGKFTYSNVVKVEMPSTSLQLSPNPATDFTNLMLPSNHLISWVKLYDASMHELKHIPIQSGSTNVKISTQHLPRGVYYVMYAEGTITRALKFIKK